MRSVAFNGSHYGYAYQTARHMLEECRKYSELRWSTWSQERRKVKYDDVMYTEMLTKYAQNAAVFIRKTGLLQQYKALDEDQATWDPIK